MRINKFLVSFGIFIVLGIFSLALAEDMPQATTPAINTDSATTSAQEGAAKINSDTQWVWGEVVSLDSQNKAVTLKYLDYEADQEKEIVIKADDATSYENIKLFDEIKVKNNLSVDYVVGAQGENIAKNINLEQDVVSIPEAAPVLTPEVAPVSVPVVETAPSGIVVPAAAENPSTPVVSTPEEAAAVVSQPTETSPAITQGQ